ncbi:MAG: glycosyltransferase family 2 protein [Burkholderiales bacterium]
MVNDLIADLSAFSEIRLEVILTHNIPEPGAGVKADLPFPVQVIENTRPKGFGANHNAAFRHARGEFFCVLNPDIRLSSNPFPALLKELAMPRAGVVSPKILDPAGGTEDSARRFPTPWFIARKLLGRTSKLDYPIGNSPLTPDWVAGMFMLFHKTVYAEVAGFDERYFLYYEDVDLCRRLRQHGYEIRLHPGASAVHDARRESRRSLRHLRWHMASMLRYFAGSVR